MWDGFTLPRASLMYLVFKNLGPDEDIKVYEQVPLHWEKFSILHFHIYLFVVYLFMCCVGVCRSEDKQPGNGSLSTHVS